MKFSLFLSLFVMSLASTARAAVEDGSFQQASPAQVTSILSGWAGLYEDQNGFRELEDGKFGRSAVRISANGIEEGFVVYSQPTESARLGEQYDYKFILGENGRFSIPSALNGAVIAEIDSPSHVLFISRAYIVQGDALIASPYLSSSNHLTPADYKLYMSYKKVK